MNKKKYSKQVILFLVAVILPSLVLVIFTLRMLDQERELLEKRSLEQRDLLVSNISSQLLSYLEQIKFEEVNAESRTFGKKQYRHPEVVLLAHLDGHDLQLPWKPVTGENLSPLLEPGFREGVANGEYSEFATGDLESAVRIYGNLIIRNRNPVQKAYLKSLLARALLKLGKSEEALDEYRQLAVVPVSFTDEFGIPLASYACNRLLDYGEGAEESLSLIRDVLETDQWLFPSVLYRLRTLADKVEKNLNESDSRISAASHLENLEAWIRETDQVLALQSFLPTLPELRNNSNSNRGATWTLYGEIPWLIRLVLDSDKQGLVIAVRLAAAQDFLSTGSSAGNLSDLNPTLVTTNEDRSEALGPSFPGLRIKFRQTGNSDNSVGWQFAYILILVLVLGTTSFGAYLVWRDIRRDIRLSEMRTQFVSSVSHELKTPLTAIRIFAETLRMGRSKNAAKQNEYLDTIVSESERLSRLINNVLDFSKIEKGSRNYRLKLASLPDLVSSCAGILEYPLKQQGFKLHVDIQEDLPEVMIDRDSIEQAILNLLNNAIKYSGNSREIELRLIRNGSYAVIQVQDFGIGIDPAEHKRIFEDYYRVDSAAESGTVGTGIGLALASHIVKGHNGRIEVESLPGEGSTFSIFLKLGEQM